MRKVLGYFGNFCLVVVLFLLFGGIVSQEERYTELKATVSAQQQELKAVQVAFDTLVKAVREDIATLNDNDTGLNADISQLLRRIDDLETTVKPTEKVAKTTTTWMNDPGKNRFW